MILKYLFRIITL